MERTGEVIQVQGDCLVVQFCRPSDCEKCHGCMGGSSQTRIMVKGKGSVGDQATVEMPTGQVVKASALAYLVPLAGLMAGMFAGAKLFPQSSDVAGMIGALCGLGVCVLGVALTEKKRRANSAWQPKLIEIKPKTEGEA